jgi:hypothetical protein
MKTTSRNALCRLSRPGCRIEIGGGKERSEQLSVLRPESGIIMLPMSNLVAARKVSSSTSVSRIGFATEGGGHWPKWDRFITLDGKKAYHIGNICGTCAFVFERLEGATDKLSPKELSAQLRNGITDLEKHVLHTATTALPAGDYNALLINCVPRLVIPSKSGDYFFEEQAALWGVDGFWGLPHYTKTEYYRTGTMKMPHGRALFEFVVPMFPSNYLHPDAIASYKTFLSQGIVPTALAISVLDVKQPANWDGEPEVTEHWCLSHYLLDGHHKFYAAYEAGKPISVLSFLAVDKGVSTIAQVAEAIQFLSANRWR